MKDGFDNAFGEGEGEGEAPPVVLDGEAFSATEFSTLPRSLKERERDIIEKCVNDRIFFCEVVLNMVLEAWQRLVLQALDNGETRIAIRSGNGVGKSCIIAVVILHYLLFRNDVKIPVTAPASSQLKDGLIPEINKWISVLPDFLKNTLTSTQDRIVRTDNPQNNFISFRTARKETPEALSGIHATFVMCAVDEASAVVEPVYEAAQGTLSTPGSIFIMISNPTRLSGFFYNVFHRLKKKWRTFHVTSFDTSRVDSEFISGIADTYGKPSIQYDVKVLGEFPANEETTLIGRDLAESAVGRDIEATTDIPVFGVDVGRGGDLSALVSRCENVVDFVATQNYSDTMKTVGWVKQLYDDAKIKPSAIYVDSIGIGAGVVDRLCELDLPAVAVNVSESSSMKTTYVRLRDELWFGLKAWFESKNVVVKLEDKTLSDMLVDEVCAPLAIFTSTGKNGVESKPQLKARFIQSPNIADALCLTFAYSGAVGSGAYGASIGSKKWNADIAYDPVGIY